MRWYGSSISHCDRQGIYCHRYIVGRVAESDESRFRCVAEAELCPLTEEGALGDDGGRGDDCFNGIETIVALDLDDVAVVGGEW